MHKKRSKMVHKTGKAFNGSNAFIKYETGQEMNGDMQEQQGS